MVLEFLGIGVGRMRLELKKTEFAPGERIRGALHLELTEPIEAKRLVVGIQARQRVVSLSAHRGTAAVGYRKDKVFEFTHELAGEQTFSSGRYRFELRVPTSANESEFGLPGGPLGDLAQVISFLSPTKRFPLEWKVFGFLDLPWRLNVKGDVPIMLTPKKAARRRRAAPHSAA